MELTSNGVTVPLGSRAAEVLLFVLRNAGNTAHKDALLAAIWPIAWLRRTISPSTWWLGSGHSVSGPDPRDASFDVQFGTLDESRWWFRVNARTALR
jgi:hypothetical protein